jgi:ADP-heptose:LPS heptosyltransferase
MKISRKLFFYYHGLGDSLLFSSVLFELGKQSRKRYFVGTKHAEIYRGNPFAIVLPLKQVINYKLGRLISLLGGEVKHVDYYHKGHPPKQHILELLADRVGLKDVPRIPKIFLSDAEKNKRLLPESKKPWVAIQSTGLSTWTDNKNWGVENFRSVARSLAREFSVVQLGASGDPSLGVDLELQGRLPIRDVFVLLRECGVFVGQEGFLMHAAAAVDLLSVIVYGGFLAPWQTGYSINENLYSNVECAPCWLETKCPHEKKCMAMITPRMVVEKIKTLLERVD